MKLIHTGDLHLGSALKSLSAEKARVRRDELTDTFRRLSLYAQKSGVYGVIIAGDLFDTSAPSLYLQREVLSIFALAPSVRFFYLTGNHDKRFAFADDLPENVCLFNAKQNLYGGGFYTYSLPENVTLTGADAAFLNGLDYSALRLPAQAFNILTLHGELTADQTATSQTATFQNAITAEPTPVADPVRIRQLKNKNINYLALGHIHNPPALAPLDGRGKYRYCGCLEGRGYDEKGEKGCYLLEIKKGRLLADVFLSFAKRTVHALTLTLSDEDFFAVERRLSALSAPIPEKDMLKITLKGNRPADGTWLPNRLIGFLNDKFFSAKLDDETRVQRETDPFDTSLRGEFLRLLSAAMADERVKDEAAQLAFTALCGEEIPL